MCTKEMAKERNELWCTELGPDPLNWSGEAPLPPPTWARDAFAPMRQAILLADAGDLPSSLKTYRDAVPDRELNDWFHLHAQYTYKWRADLVGIPSPRESHVPDDERDRPLKGPEDELALAVFARDSYRCRYCTMQLLSPKAFKRYEHYLDREEFCLAGKANPPKPGASLVFSLVADHLYPRSRGGLTNLDNLVTSCWACNYGKMDYSVEELGIADPRERPPVDDGWDGLRYQRLP